MTKRNRSHGISIPSQTTSSKSTVARRKLIIDLPPFTAGPAEGNINPDVFVPPSTCAAPVAVGCVVAVMSPPRESYEAGLEGELGLRVTRTGKPCWSHRVTTTTCSGPERVEKAEAGEEGYDKGEGWDGAWRRKIYVSMVEKKRYSLLMREY